jgi:hypothetical protein|tara:strand:+ start:2857 stop:3450 length:594 start_codon:yes stop_codon:yes gene_type:complete
MLRDPNKIFEIENPFPQWLVSYIENQTKDVDWKFVNVPEEDEQDGNYKTPALFTNVMYCTSSNILDDHKELSNMLHTALTMDIIPKYIPDAHVNQVTRTRLNGTVQGVYYGPHNDVRNGQPGLWTFVYYVNDADGDTVFFSDDGKTEMKRTKYKKGNGVLFPAHYWHTMDVTSVPLRVSIGMTYSIETKLNAEETTA